MTVVRRIKPTGLGLYEQALARRLPETTRIAFTEAGEHGVGLLQRASVSIKDLAKFQAGWMHFADAKHLRLWNRERHGINVEGGRGPNKKMPPHQVLLEWCQRHGIDERRVFAVRRAIGRRGILPRPVLASDPMQSELKELVVQRLRSNWAMAMEKAAHHG